MPEQPKNDTTHLFAAIGALTERGARVSRVTSAPCIWGYEALARDGLVRI